MDNWKPKIADDFTTEEKCKAFDKLYKMVAEHYRCVENNERNKDYTQYTWEAVMELCLGKDVFKHYNELMNNYEYSE